MLSGAQNKSVWFLYRLDRDGAVYTPHLIDTFSDIDAAVKRQDRLQRQGMQTQLSNTDKIKSHRIFDL